MADSITMPLDKGGATDIDPTLLKPGYLQEAEGVAYVVGDPAAHKIGGRQLFNTTSPASAAVNGINFVSFDSPAADYVTAQMNGTLYSALSTVGTFGSVRTGLTAGSSMIDRTKFADAAYFCNGTENWVYKSDNTTFNWGLNPQTVAPTGAFVGTGITGTFIYWTTEYDATNDVESAYDNTTGLTQAPLNQTVRITRPATINSSSTHWRLYRTMDLGSYPVGYRVATVLKATTTFDDATTDAALVFLPEYERVAINDIPEPQNFPPPIFRSVATFEGSLVGVADRSLYFSETGTPHYFPESYKIPLRPVWGGQARCVRAVNKALLVFFDNDTFRVNTLPKAADSFFDSGVVQEHIANYGTPSPLGACRFSGWGGAEIVFLASRSGPMLTDGNAFDSAVLNLDWSIIPPANLSTAVCIDNPDEFRVELSFLDADNDWRVLHFYYGQTEISQERGFPEMSWTGPHLVPGPGTFGTLNGAGKVWTGSRANDGKVYREDEGYFDAALLVDSSGTINFRMRTGRFYCNGINSQCTIGRLFLSKADVGTGTYAVTLSSWNEGDAGEPKQTTRQIDATVLGATSDDFNRGAQSHDVRVVRDDALFMPPINNLTLMLRDEGEFVKTNRR